MSASSLLRHSTPPRLEPRPRRRRTVVAAVSILACLMVLLVVTASSATANPMAGGDMSALQSDLNALVASGAPGAILLVRGRDGTTRLTAGVADIATGRAIRASDRYRVASLAKSFVATVVLQLVGEGKLRLGDTVERWLPGLVPNGENITIRHLLSHTSGIFNYELDPRISAPYLSGDLGYYWSPLSIIEIAISHEPLYPPGETAISTYSNTNYILAGLIVEAATGKPIEVQMRQRIFKPLDLDATSYPLSETAIEGRHAHGYALLGPPPLLDITEFSPSIAGAGGALISTVGDMARFYRALLRGRLLRPDLLAAMKTTIPADSDVESRYGLGLADYATACGSAWGHSGSFPGYWNYAFTSADGKRQAVLMVNIEPTSVDPTTTGRLFIDILYSAYCSTA
jgi:D-alanyl-D-alanine carboxypeptidase